MKNLNELNDYRVELFGDIGDAHNGAFKIKIKGEQYTIIASNGGDWEHVSVASLYKIPSWSTMQRVKEMFFHDHEIVMQLHPKKSEHININNNCLHLWRPLKESIPTPPQYMV